MSILLCHVSTGSLRMGVACGAHDYHPHPFRERQATSLRLPSPTSLMHVVVWNDPGALSDALTWDGVDRVETHDHASLPYPTYASS